MIDARLSTAKTFILGPILDADGVAKTDEVVANIKVTKNGTVGAPNGSSTLTHNHTGNYIYAGNAGDFDTLGEVTFSLNDGTNAMGARSFNVMTANAYDSKYSDDKLEVDVAQWLGTDCVAPTTAGYPRVAPDWAQIENKTAAADLSSTQIGSVNTKTGYELSATGVTAVQSGLSTLTAQQVWEYATRSLSTFGTLVADIATAVWGAVSRTFTGAAENAIDAQAIKADAVTKIQNGLATPTNITAGTITTTTNVTNAPTNGDLTATQKTSVQAAVAAALNAAIPAEPGAGSINERMDWIEEMSEDAP